MPLIHCLLFAYLIVWSRSGSVVERRAPEREVQGSLDHTLSSPKYWLIPRKRWLCPSMTEKKLTGALNKKQTKLSYCLDFHFFSPFRAFAQTVFLLSFDFLLKLFSIDRKLFELIRALADFVLSESKSQNSLLDFGLSEISFPI